MARTAKPKYIKPEFRGITLVVMGFNASTLTTLLAFFWASYFPSRSSIVELATGFSSIWMSPLMTKHDLASGKFAFLGAFKFFPSSVKTRLSIIGFDPSGALGNSMRTLSVFFLLDVQAIAALTSQAGSRMGVFVKGLARLGIFTLRAEFVGEYLRHVGLLVRSNLLRACRVFSALTGPFYCSAIPC